MSCINLQIHDKKRNRLAQQRLNSLVFVKYNRALKRRYDTPDRIDLISLKDIDDSNEWLMGRMDGSSDQEEDFVFEDDYLTWSTVARAAGVEEIVHHTRSAKGTSVMAKGKAKVSSSQSKISTPLKLRDEEEDIDFEEEYEEEWKTF